jgi:hypothetical protein
MLPMAGDACSECEPIFAIGYRHRPDFGLQADLLLRFAIYEKLSRWIRLHQLPYRHRSDISWWSSLHRSACKPILLRG